MDDPAEFSLQKSADAVTAVLTGDWTAVTLGSAGIELDQALAGVKRIVLDLTQMDRMDTAGAFAVIRAAGPRFDLKSIQARPETHRLLKHLAPDPSLPVPYQRREAA